MCFVLINSVAAYASSPFTGFDLVDGVVSLDLCLQVALFRTWHYADTLMVAIVLLLMQWPRLQALVYGILSSTTAVFSYAIGSRKLPANEQFLLLVLKQK